MTQNVTCPCDAPAATAPQNPPGLERIAFRETDFAAIRAALLRPLADETQLTAWRPGASGDLALMMAEWFAYLGDILTFYNERIANEAYLGTAVQARSVTDLVRLLGYRPQPGIGASATLAALLPTGPNHGRTATLPAGLQVTSKPGPGQKPQTFELSTSVSLTAPDVVTAMAPVSLLSPSPTTILLAGAASGLMGGDHLLLRPRAGGAGHLVLVGASEIKAPPNGPKTTQLTVSFPKKDAPLGASAASLRLDRPTLSASPWSLTASYIGSDGAIHLSGLARALKHGDPVLILIARGAPILAQVETAREVLWRAGDLKSLAVAATPLIPHTAITLAGGATIPPRTKADRVTLLYNFVEAATLLDQPAPIWPGGANPPQLVTAAAFPAATGAPVLIADANGAGVRAKADSAAGSQVMTVADLDAPAPELRAPVSVLYNLLAFTRGKTVAAETLGSGDPAQANQTFMLAKGPLTYLRPAATLVSTLSIKVNGQVWTEAPSFFGQKPDARIFVTAQDENQATIVMFGDGVNGARLPAGVGNIVASYRFESGAQSPPAGALTVVATPHPGLRAVLNPVAASGGADPEPPDQIRVYAPRSALTFGRAVSAADHEAIAAQIAAGPRVRAVWAFDPANQCGGVTVYVAGGAATVAHVREGLAAVGDPTRPARVIAATPIPVALGLDILIAPSADPATVEAAVAAALTDPMAGLFGARRLRIGQSVFDSQIAAACLGAVGVVALRRLSFSFGAPPALATGEMHQAPEGGYFDLDPGAIRFTTKAAGDG